MSLVSRCLMALALLVLAGPASAQTPAKPPKEERDERAESIRSRYTKFEYRIPMRDGARLFTSVYVPNDAAADVLTGGANRDWFVFHTADTIADRAADETATQV